MIRCLVLLTAVTAFSACSPGSRIESFRGSTMGTYYSVKVAASANIDRRALKSEIEKTLDHLNDVFSTYLEDSELSRINRLERGQTASVSPEMRRLLGMSKNVWRKTDGYFDITVGPLVNAWGFGPDKNKKRPDKKELAQARANTGMEKFSLSDTGEFQKKRAGVYLDLSAAAKGYGVDQVHEMLTAKGFKSVLVEIGGEVKASGKKPGGESWLIGIEKPTEELGAGIQAVVALDDMAMATSGSYRNYVKYGDEVFSHTIDPVNKAPAQNNVISVTVLNSSCALADAYATALLAMGGEKALETAKKLELAAYFIVKKGSKTGIVSTKRFKSFLKEESL